MTELKTEQGYRLWDVDNQRYVGPVFDIKESAIYFANDFLKANLDKYNEQSKFEIHTENIKP